MSKKHFIIFSSYAAAVIAALAIFSFVSHRKLEVYRAASMHSSQLAFEETVNAVLSMSRQLEKTPYATDADMRGRLCAHIYADALAAEAAMSTLPFTTHELEQISGYVNRLGDYAYSLCSKSSEDFGEKERETLSEMSELASSLAASLSVMQTQVHEGSVLIESLEQRRGSAGMSSDGSISGEFARLEAEFPGYDSPEYEGRYAQKTKLSSQGGGRKRSDAEMLAMAAGILGVNPAELSLEYEYQNSLERKCYRRGDALVCVGPEGVETMSRARLVSEENISLDEAEKIAGAFLEKQGLKDLKLLESESAGGLAYLNYAAEKNGILYPDNRIALRVALDDGSIHSYSALDYSPELPKTEWPVSAEAAAATLPAGLERQEAQRQVLESESGAAVPCYAFECTGSRGEKLWIYVNAQTGKQHDILIN